MIRRKSMGRCINEAYFISCNLDPWACRVSSSTGIYWFCVRRQMSSAVCLSVENTEMNKTPNHHLLERFGVFCSLQWQWQLQLRRGRASQRTKLAVSWCPRQSLLAKDCEQDIWIISIVFMIMLFLLHLGPWKPVTGCNSGLSNMKPCCWKRCGVI